MDLGSAEYQLIDTWVAEYILRNDLNSDGLPTYNLCLKGYIMKILTTALSILKSDKDASRLPLVTTLLEELIGKIGNQSLRLKILKCFLSLKLKIALDTLSNLQKSKSESSCENLDGLLVVKEEFLATLREPEIRGVRKHVEEMKVWIKKNKNQLIPLCQKEGAKEVCIKEFEVVMKETKDVLGKSFIEELASAITTAMQKNEEHLGTEQHHFSDLTAMNPRKRKYISDDSCTEFTTKKTRKSDEESNKKDEKTAVFNNSPALSTQTRKKRRRRREKFTRTKGSGRARSFKTQSPCLFADGNSVFTSVKPSGEDKNALKVVKHSVMDKSASRVAKEDKSASRALSDSGSDHSASITSVNNIASKASNPSVMAKTASRSMRPAGEDRSASSALKTSGIDQAASISAMGNIASKILKPSVTRKSASSSARSLGGDNTAPRSGKLAGEDRSASRVLNDSGIDQTTSMTATGNNSPIAIKPSANNNSTETLIVTVHNNSSDREVTLESSFNGSNAENPPCDAKIVDNDHLDFKSSKWREELNEPIPSRNSIEMFTESKGIENERNHVIDEKIESQKNHGSFDPECLILPERPSTAKHAASLKEFWCRSEIPTISERVGLFGTTDGRHAVSNYEAIGSGNLDENPDGLNGNELLLAKENEGNLNSKITLLDNKNKTANDAGSKNRSPSTAEEINISDDDMEGSSPILISTPKRSNTSMRTSPKQSQSQQSTPDRKASEGEGSGINTPQRRGFVDCIDRGIKQLELAINCIRKGFNSSFEKFSSENSSQTSQTTIKDSLKTSFVSHSLEKVATAGKTANSLNKFQSQSKKTHADASSIPLIEISSDSDACQDSDQTNYSGEFTSANKGAAKKPKDGEQQNKKKKSAVHNYPSCGIEISQDDSFQLSISSDSSDSFLDD